jgi:hypothetical protein
VLRKAQLHELEEEEGEEGGDNDDEELRATITESHRGVPMLLTHLRVPVPERQYLAAAISVGDVWGAQAAIDLPVQMQYHTPLRALFITLKALLRQHGLGDACQGGLSSYCLFLMVRSSLSLACMKSEVAPACCSSAPSCMPHQPVRTHRLQVQASMCMGAGSVPTVAEGAAVRRQTCRWRWTRARRRGPQTGSVWSRQMTAAAFQLGISWSTHGLLRKPRCIRERACRGLCCTSVTRARQVWLGATWEPC